LHTLAIHFSQVLSPTGAIRSIKQRKGITGSQGNRKGLTSPVWCRGWCGLAELR
jgi:hypothetical protein